MPTPREAYTNRVEQRGSTTARLRPADFGSAGETLGRAISGFGQDIGKVAADYEEVQKEFGAAEARQADTAAQRERMEVLYGAEGFFNLKGQAAVAAAPNVQKKLDEIDKKYGGTINNRWGQKGFRDISARRAETILPNVMKHTGEQRVAWDDEVDAGQMETAADTAVVEYKDPLSVARNLHTVARAAERRARRAGLSDPKAIGNEIQKATGEAIKRVASQFGLKGDDLQATSFVEANEHLMDPDDFVNLLTALQPGAEKERAKLDVRGGGGIYTDGISVAGGASGGGVTAESGYQALIQVESGGRAGAVGQPTQYGTAIGASQMLPETARAMADKLGVAWNESLYKGKSEEAKAYQLKLGAAYWQEGWDKYGGDVRKAAMYYHGGPDESKWGEKTRHHADKVVAALGGQAAAAAPAAPADPELAAMPERLRAKRSNPLVKKDHTVEDAREEYGMTTAEAEEFVKTGKDTRKAAEPAIGGGVVRQSQLPIWESAPINSEFGPRETGTHGGIDLDYRLGAPVKATMDGVIEHRNQPDGFGVYAVIDHGGGVETYYGHLSGYRTGNGQQVKQGQVIGVAGSTGKSTGAHLHYELRVDGKSVDPKTFGEKDINTGTASAGPVRPAAPGRRRLDLTATIRAIEADDTLPRARKDARIAAYKEEAGLEAEDERADERDVREAMTRWVNTLPTPDQFTNFDSAPADVRMALAQHPDAELYYRTLADGNQEAADSERRRIAGERATREAAERTAKVDQLELQLEIDRVQNPARFANLPFMSDPKYAILGAEKLGKWIKAAGEASDTSRINPETIGTTIDNYATSEMKQNKLRMANLYRQGNIRAQILLRENGGKPLSRVQYDAIALEVMQTVEVKKPGGGYQTVRVGDVTNLLQPGQEVETRLSHAQIRTMAIAALQRKHNRPAMPGEIEDWIEEYAHGPVRPQARPALPRTPMRGLGR